MELKTYPEIFKETAKLTFGGIVEPRKCFCGGGFVDAILRVYHATANVFMGCATWLFCVLAFITLPLSSYIFYLVRKKNEKRCRP